MLRNTQPVQNYQYDLDGYASMLLDPRRKLYGEALKKLITPSTTVLEIGGGTGFFACLASRFGARKVLSIDPNPLIERASQCAADNGLTNIEFIRGLSTELELEEKADIILHDLRGALPLFENSIASLRDARRHLAEGGCFLARRDTIYAALVDDPLTDQRCFGPWDGQLDGLTLTAFASKRTPLACKLNPSEAAQFWPKFHVATLDYGSLDSGTALHLETEIESDRTGLCHAIVLWFDCELCEGVGFSTAPGQQKGTAPAVYEPFWLPVRPAIAVALGQRLVIRLSFWQRSISGPMEWEVATTDEAGRLTPLFMSSHTGSPAPMALNVGHARFPKKARAKMFAADGLRAGDSVPQVMSRLMKKFPKQVPDREAARSHIAMCAQWLGLQPRKEECQPTFLSGLGVVVEFLCSHKIWLNSLLVGLQPFWKRTEKTQPLHRFSVGRYKRCFTLMQDEKEVYHGLDFLRLQQNLRSILLDILRDARPDLLLIPLKLTRQDGRALLILPGPTVSATDENWVLLDPDGKCFAYQTGVGEALPGPQAIDGVLVAGQSGAPTRMGPIILQIFQLCQHRMMVGRAFERLSLALRHAIVVRSVE